MSKIPESRMNHMHGVAEYMYKNAEKYGLNANKMFVLGLFHYIADDKEHEVMGARL